MNFPSTGKAIRSALYPLPLLVGHAAPILVKYDFLLLPSRTCYEGVVFTRGAIRLHRAADESLRRFCRSGSCCVRIKESSFCLRTIRATLASFRIAAARSTVPMSLGGYNSNCLATADPMCNRHGDTQNSCFAGTTLSLQPRISVRGC
jgi:hypothetical protein